MALTDENMNTQSNDDVVDLTINVAKRTRFRINGDNSKIIALNLSDFGFAVRLKEGAKKLSEKVMLVQNYDSEDENFSEKLKQIDAEMREYVDYIFDYPVSDVLAKDGTMYDPKDGKYRYEAIFDVLLPLYEESVRTEYAKIKSNMTKYTDKYTAPKSKSTKRK